MKLLLCLLLISVQTLAAPKILKLAFLAPEGVTWSNGIEAIAKEVEEKTAKRVTFKLYFGGVAGDESDVLRKVRIGQLSGAMFTGKTLGDIDKDVRVLEIPFTFHQHPENGIKTLNQLSDVLKSSLQKKGFVALGFYEVGHVYLGLTKEAKDLASLQGTKIWTWEGDKIAEAMIEALGLVAVPLALPDVLSSLSSGIIQAAYAPPLGMSALQWHTKLKYIINYPIAYATGALLISQKDWSQISQQDQKIIQDITSKHLDQTNIQTAKDNIEALEEFKNMGIKIIDFPASDYARSQEIRQKVVKKLTGTFFSPQAITQLEEIKAKF